MIKENKFEKKQGGKTPSWAGNNVQNNRTIQSFSIELGGGGGEVSRKGDTEVKDGFSEREKRSGLTR